MGHVFDAHIKTTRVYVRLIKLNFTENEDKLKSYKDWASTLA